MSDYVSPTEAARLLSVHRSTVYDWAKQGKFRMLRVGGRTLIPKSELIDMVESAPSVYGPMERKKA